MTPATPGLGNPLTGAACLLRGFRLICRPGLRRFVIIPLTINTLLFTLLLYYLGDAFNGLLTWLLPQWLLDWLLWIVWPLFALAAICLLWFGFALLAALIAAPFNSLLALAVERELRGHGEEANSDWRGILKEVSRTLWSELRKLSYILLRALPLLLLFLVPGLNLAAPLLWFVFGAWMFSLEYADYPMGNHGILFPEQRRKLAEQRLLSLGFGAGVALALLLPLVNFFVMPAAVAGATLMWVERLAPEQAVAPVQALD